jgi:hypothetical protein
MPSASAAQSLLSSQQEESSLTGICLPSVNEQLKIYAFFFSVFLRYLWKKNAVSS